MDRLEYETTEDYIHRLKSHIVDCEMSNRGWLTVQYKINEYDKLKADNARMLEALKYVKKCLGVLLVAGDTPEKRAYNEADIAIDKVEGGSHE